MDPLSIALAVAVVLLSIVFFLVKGRGSAPARPPAAAKAEAKVESFPNGPLLIVWGSQTGTAESFGNILAREARQRGFKATSVDMEDFEPDELREEDKAPVVFLMATHGEGEPPDNALAFFKYFNEPDREADELASLRFAAFGLGNTQYEEFCYMGKWIDERCAAFGATRLYELGLGDDDDDLEGDFEAWREGLWEALCPGGAVEVTTAPPPQFESKMLDGGEAGHRECAAHRFHRRLT